MCEWIWSSLVNVSSGLVQMRVIRSCKILLPFVLKCVLVCNFGPAVFCTERSRITDHCRSGSVPVGACIHRNRSVASQFFLHCGFRMLDKSVVIKNLSLMFWEGTEKISSLAASIFFFFTRHLWTFSCVL